MKIKQTTFLLLISIVISGVIFCFTNPAKAKPIGKKVTFEDVIIIVNNLPKIVGYRDTLKPGIERQISEFGNNDKVSAEDRLALRNGYEITSQKFNAWVDMIKADLLCLDSLKRMKSSVDSSTYFAKKYAFGYIGAIEAYETNLKPVTDRIQLNQRPVDPEMIKMGFEVTLAIVNIIKTWNEHNQFENLSILNASINTLFANQLHMKPWNSLVQLPIPVNTRISAPVSLPIQTTTTIQPLPTHYYVGSDQIRVGKSTLSCPLSGSFQLMKYSNSQVVPVSLTIGASRLTVEYDDFVSGHVQPVEVKTTNFEAPMHSGDFFRMHITTSCYVYVFALNNDGTCEPVYPFNDLLGQVTNPLMDRDLTNTFVVPHQDPASGNGVSMKICANCSQENLAIIFSRAEFDINELMFKVSRLPGSLDQRLAGLFTNQNLNPTDGILKVQMSEKVNFFTSNPPSESVVAFALHMPVSK